MSVPSTTSVISLFSVSAILNFWYAHDYCTTLSTKNDFLIQASSSVTIHLGNITKVTNQHTEGIELLNSKIEGTKKKAEIDIKRFLIIMIFT